MVEEALRASYEMASEETAVQGSRLLIENVPIVVYCQQCRLERRLASIQNFSCPECGTPTPEVRHGKELEVVALEITQ